MLVPWTFSDCLSTLSAQEWGIWQRGGHYRAAGQKWNVSLVPINTLGQGDSGRWPHCKAQVTRSLQGEEWPTSHKSSMLSVNRESGRKATLATHIAGHEPWACDKGMLRCKMQVTSPMRPFSEQLLWNNCFQQCFPWNVTNLKVLDKHTYKDSAFFCFKIKKCP